MLQVMAKVARTDKQYINATDVRNRLSVFYILDRFDLRHDDRSCGCVRDRIQAVSRRLMRLLPLDVPGDSRQIAETERSGLRIPSPARLAWSRRSRLSSQHSPPHASLHFPIGVGCNLANLLLSHDRPALPVRSQKE